MARRRWTESTLNQRRKGDAEKVKIAVRLRQEPPVTLAWMAERKGTKTHLAHLLYWNKRGDKKHETVD